MSLICRYHTSFWNNQNRHNVELERGPSLKKWFFWGIFVAALIPAYTGAFSDSRDLDEAAKQEQLFVIRTKQIALLDQFLKKYPDSPKTSDSLFRLGEAYYEVGKYHVVKNNLKKAETHFKLSKNVLERLRKQDPSFARLDEALFVLANTNIELNDMDDAGNVLAEISEKYPLSPIIKQAALLLGDHYFSKKLYARAETFYQQALEGGKSESYLNYKLAWVSLSLNQPARSLHYFEQVIALRPKTKGGDYSRDAAKEMVWPALEVHAARNVIPYLERTLTDADLLQISLSSFGTGLLKRAEYELASNVFEKLQTRFPKSSDAETWASAQLKAEEGLGRTTNLTAIISRLQNASAASIEVQAQLLASARKFHAEAQKTKTLDHAQRDHAYDLAIGYYQAYLSRAKIDAIRAQTEFYYGEALYARGRFAEAASAYERSAQTKSDVRARAVWNWFLTSEKLADGFQFNDKQFRATSSRDENYLLAARYMQNIPEVPLEHKRRASYQSARLLYQLNDFDRALPVFQYLAEKFRGTPEGKLSSQLVLDIFNQRKDYKNVARFARSYQAEADSSTRGDLSILEQQALLKSIAEEEKLAQSQAGEARLQALQAAGDRYVEFARSYPQSSLVDSALWAGIQLHMTVAADRKDKNFTALDSSFKLMTSRYGNSRYTPEAVKFMGRFLAYQHIDSSKLKDYEAYRDAWASQMKQEPREKQGVMGMMVYRLSDDSAKRALLADFKALPLTDDNREAYAYGKLTDVIRAKRRLEAISLSDLKTLTKNTQTKINSLEKLQGLVTELVKLKVAEPAIQGLNILADGYMNVASAIRSAPVPGQLQAAQRTKYQQIVSDKVQSLVDKGVEARRLADEKAKELALSAG